MSTRAATPRRVTGVAWGRVATFYAIALLGPVSAALVVGLAGESFAGVPPLWAQGTVMLAMLFPLVAGLLVERRAGRRPRLAAEWASVRADVWDAVRRIGGWSVLAFLLVWVGAVALVLLSTAVGLPGVGRLATATEVGDNLRALAPQAPAGLAVPALPLLLGSVTTALVVGFTINGLVALGEEYGWRGVLFDELAPLGRAGRALLTGMLWGLWHVPLFPLGYNYGAAWLPGIGVFVLFCTAMHLVLAWVRERSGSVLAPAIVHGAFNGFAGLFQVVLVARTPLLGPPVGLAMVAVLGVVAAVLYGVVDRRRPGHVER